MQFMNHRRIFDTDVRYMKVKHNFLLYFSSIFVPYKVQYCIYRLDTVQSIRITYTVTDYESEYSYILLMEGIFWIFKVTYIPITNIGKMGFRALILYKSYVAYCLCTPYCNPNS